MTVRIAQLMLYSIKFSQNCQPRWNICNNRDLDGRSIIKTASPLLS